MRPTGREMCVPNHPPGGDRVRSQGQSVVELALLLPLLMLLFAALIEGSLALNAWIRVNTAARDATRFVLDAGPLDQAQSLVLRKLNGLDTSQLNIYIIKGATGDNGHISGPNGSWLVLSCYGICPGQPRVVSSTIDIKLNSQGTTAATDVPFFIVEVDYNYKPLVLGTFINRVSIPMTSYAIVQQVQQPSYGMKNQRIRNAWVRYSVPVWKPNPQF